MVQKREDIRYNRKYISKRGVKLLLIGGFYMPGNTSILIVEDEKPIARFIQMELEHEGYDCGIEYNGAAALDRICPRTLRSHTPRHHAPRHRRTEHL